MSRSKDLNLGRIWVPFGPTRCLPERPCLASPPTKNEHTAISRSKVLSQGRIWVTFGPTRCLPVTPWSILETKCTRLHGQYSGEYYVYGITFTAMCFNCAVDDLGKEGKCPEMGKRISAPRGPIVVKFSPKYTPVIRPIHYYLRFHLRCPVFVRQPVFRRRCAQKPKF